MTAIRQLALGGEIPQLIGGEYGIRVGEEESRMGILAVPRTPILIF
jgi:hypothetical protein